VGLQGQTLTEMGELADAGCVAFGQAAATIRDTQVLLRALQYAATFDYRVWLPTSEVFLSNGGVAHDGEVAARLGLSGIPVLAETVAISTAVLLARETGARLHLPLISSAAGLAMVRAAKAEGLPITCGVSVNHLHLCDIDIGYFDPHCRMDPPLRAQSDREALRRGLADGSIDAACSDHTPVDDDAKQLPFGEAEIGATGLELLLPLTLKWAQEMQVPLLRALARVTVEPARILGLDTGHLRPGARADVCIYPQDAWRVTRGALKSQGKNTPFLGYELPGRVKATLVSGQVVFEGNGAAR
jgi:dihydroorotase